MKRISVIGAGAWGTALSLVACRSAQVDGRNVSLWAREAAVAREINASHRNEVYLPRVRLDEKIRATDDLEEALEGAEMVLFTAPAQHVRRISKDMAPYLSEGVPIVICAKGIEQESGALMTEVLAETLPGATVAVLSGPTFAAEVARSQPTAVTLAVADRKLGQAVASALGGRAFRPYLASDLIGVQIGGAVKNVVAIACGIVGGRGLGNNARAALITRGLAEMVRLGVAKGGKAETLMGLSGLGDLTLTCNGPQSRNMSLGTALGQGESLDAILANRRSVAEGVWTAASIVALAAKLEVDMPISAAIDAILHHGARIEDTIEDLLARPLKAE